MALSQEAMRKLARLGYASHNQLRFWHRLWESEGESFFWRFLRKEEETAEEYRRWLPRLRAFTAECRRLTPVPSIDSLSPADKEQHRVLLTKMREFAASEDRAILACKPNRATILSTTWVGLSAAEEVFGGCGAVILQESERERWFSDVYQAEEERFWWYTLAWWTLREGLNSEDEERIRREYPIPDGDSYWVVVSGVQWGDLAGGAGHELWRWDGRWAEFIELYCVDTY